MQAKIFVDSVDEVLQVRLEYHYGEKVLNPFQPAAAKAEQDQVILIREAEKEEAIMAILESCPLRILGNYLYLEGEANVYDFLYETLPKLEDQADIFLTNAVKSLILPSRHVPVTNIDMDSSGNWLDISFNIEGIAQDDVQNILLSAVEKKKFYRLPNGAFVSLASEEYASIQNMLQEFHIKPSQLKNESLQLPLYRGMQLEEVMKKEKGSNAKYGRQFRRLLNSLKNPEQLEFDVPNLLQATLRDYQNYGFQWLSTLNHYRLGGILADDMGLGKTLQSIALFYPKKKGIRTISRY
nr:SNF2 helicase associated domain-containing protein [Mesobacillus boroniphilus]